MTDAGFYVDRVSKRGPWEVVRVTTRQSADGPFAHRERMCLKRTRKAALAQAHAYALEASDAR